MKSGLSSAKEELAAAFINFTFSSAYLFQGMSSEHSVIAVCLAQFPDLNSDDLVSR
jgi:hypothetical protein